MAQKKLEKAKYERPRLAMLRFGEEIVRTSAGKISWNWGEDFTQDRESTWGGET